MSKLDNDGETIETSRLHVEKKKNIEMMILIACFILNYVSALRFPKGQPINDIIYLFIFPC